MAKANKVKLDKVKVKQLLSDHPTYGLDATSSEIDAALVTVDQDAIHNTHLSAWSTEIWDRVSPINGVPAQHFLDREDVDENGTDDIYLLLKDGVVVGFQPHDPDKPGHVRIAKGKGKAFADKHADKIASDNTDVEIIQKIRKYIKENRTPAP